MPIHNYAPEVHCFLTRLDDFETTDIIRQISRAINNGSGKDYLTSDPYEDMNIEIDYPYFYIEDFRLPLNEIKTILYDWLYSINPKSKEYISEIEETDSKSLRQEWLLKFNRNTNISGNQKEICESLLHCYKPLCFVQFCSLKDCNYMIKQIEKALLSNEYNCQLYKNSFENISIKISSNWFKIGNLTNDNYWGIGLESAKKFIQEWIDFIDKPTK